MLPLGCGGGGERASAGSCADRARVDGVLLGGVGVERAHRAPPVKGTVVVEVLGCERDSTQTVPRFRDVDPRLGLPRGTVGSQRILWLPVTGRLPVLRGYPLHRAAFGRKPVWPSLQGKQCVAGRQRGRVIWMDQLGTQVDLRRHARVIRVEMTPGVRYRGRHTLGQPFLRRGDQVVVTGRRCRARTIRARTFSLRRR